MILLLFIILVGLNSESNDSIFHFQKGYAIIKGEPVHSVEVPKGSAPVFCPGECRFLRDGKTFRVLHHGFMSLTQLLETSKDPSHDSSVPLPGGTESIEIKQEEEKPKEITAKESSEDSDELSLEESQQIPAGLRAPYPPKNSILLVTQKLELIILLVSTCKVECKVTIQFPSQKSVSAEFNPNTHPIFRIKADLLEFGKYSWTLTDGEHSSQGEFEIWQNTTENQVKAIESGRPVEFL